MLLFSISKISNIQVVHSCITGPKGTRQTICRLTLHLLIPGFRSPGSAYVEGDASSASYFLAGAAVTGGTITVEGCGTTSLQVCIMILEQDLELIGVFLLFKIRVAFS